MNINLDIHIIKNRQCTIPVTINKKNYIYADISNNKKKNIINMADIEKSVKNLNKIPIKEYNSESVLPNKNISDHDNRDTQKLSSLDKKILKEKVQTLSKDECRIVFRMIKSDTLKYTENNNGIFINLDNISDDTLYKIFTYVNKVTENKLDNTVSLVENLQNSQALPVQYQSKIKLSNYEKSIIKRNNYMEEQKDFKSNNNWFIKKDSLGNDISE